MKQIKGARVLVVEDESILAMFIEDTLHDLGCVVVGPALGIEEAQVLAAEAQLDAAILDINLGDATSSAIAQILRGRNTPFCFSTGYGAVRIADEFAGTPVLIKPYTKDRLVSVLQELLT